MKKLVSENPRIYLEWELKETEKGHVFSGSGSVYNEAGTDIERGGQCVDAIAEMLPHNDFVQEFHYMWDLYHLNDMHAGTPDQEKYIRENIKPKYEALKEEAIKVEEDRQKAKENLQTLLQRELGLPGRRFEVWLDYLTKLDLGKVKRLLFSREHPDKPAISALGFVISKSTVLKLQQPEVEVLGWYQFCVYELVKAHLIYDYKYTSKGKLFSKDELYCYKNNKDPYRYGTRWLFRPIPEDDLKIIKSWTAEPMVQPQKTEFEKMVDSYTFSCKFVKSDDFANIYEVSFNDQTFKWQQGFGIKGEPDKYHVMECLIRDAQSADIDTLIELGYSYSEAKIIAKECQKVAVKLDILGVDYEL